jgi:hypothetical protein
MNKEAREAIYWMLSSSILTCAAGAAFVGGEAGLACGYASIILLTAFLTLLFIGWFR